MGLCHLPLGLGSSVIALTSKRLKRRSCASFWAQALKTGSFHFLVLETFALGALSCHGRSLAALLKPPCGKIQASERTHLRYSNLIPGSWIPPTDASQCHKGLKNASQALSKFLPTNSTYSYIYIKWLKHNGILFLDHVTVQGGSFFLISGPFHVVAQEPINWF